MDKPNFVFRKKQVYYGKFFQNLFTCSSKKIGNLARIVSRDAKSTVFRNVQFLLETSGLSPWDFANWRIVQKIDNSPVPHNNGWRMSLLLKLLATRSEKKASLEDCKHLTLMIDSLCNTQMLTFSPLIGLLENPHYLKICSRMRGASSYLIL